MFFLFEGRSKWTSHEEDIKDYDESILNIAVGLVQNKNISSYDAEKQFDIPRRTILNKVKQKHLKNIGGPTKLSPADEQKIASCLIPCG